MKIGMIGLGKMGANMTERLLKGGHEVVAYDLSAEALEAAAAKGAETADHPGRRWRRSSTRPGRSGSWCPAGTSTDSTVEELAGLFGAGDVIIDGGNSNYKEWMAPGVVKLESIGRRLRGRRHLGRRVGPDRGLLPHGRRHQGGGGGRGAGAPDPGARGRLRPRRPGRVRATSSRWCTTASSTASCRPTPRASRSWARPTSSTSTSTRSPPSGATAPWCAAGCSTWPSGRCGPAPGFDEIKGVVVDSGEGRWTAQEAIDRGVAAPVISTSLFTRFAVPEPGLAAAQDALRAAQPVRWPRRDARVGPAGPGDRDPDALTPIACSPRSTMSRAPSATPCAAPSRRARATLRARALGRPDGAGVLRGAGHGRRHRLGPWWTSTSATSAWCPPTTRTPTRASSGRPCSTASGGVGSFSPDADRRARPRMRGRLPAHHVRPGDRSRHRPHPPRDGARRAHGLALPRAPPPSMPAGRAGAGHRGPHGVNPHPRLTLTLPAINSARLAVFTVAGASKAAAVAALLRGETCRRPGPCRAARCGWSTAPRSADSP